MENDERCWVRVKDGGMKGKKSDGTYWPENEVY